MDVNEFLAKVLSVLEQQSKRLEELELEIAELRDNRDYGRSITTSLHASEGATEEYSPGIPSEMDSPLMKQAVDKIIADWRKVSR